MYTGYLSFILIIGINEDNPILHRTVYPIVKTMTSVTTHNQSQCSSQHFDLESAHQKFKVPQPYP